MIRLYDERDKSFEITGLKAIKSYLGEGFENCEDAFDIDDKLREENCGMIGYRCEKIDD